MLGIASLIPTCFVPLISVVVNVVAITKSKSDVRWRPIVGLVLTLLAVVLQILFVAFYNIFQDAD